jgi:acyl transferase domain-containing protein/acyl-CoA synthetase (AMP-forming)/AMP-acid ligase II/acyl carrier protein
MATGDDFGPATLVSAIGLHAAANPDAPAVTFVTDGAPPVTVTYGELHDRVLAAGRVLTAAGARGERVLLAVNAGLDYVVAFCGCLYAGAVPVPAYPPRDHRAEHALSRLRALARDSRAALGLTSPGVQDKLDKLELGPLDGFRGWLTTDQLASVAPTDGPFGPADRYDVAFLQYTSGSTGSPKGVIVPHATLSTNVEALSRTFGIADGTVTVSWLPPFHDMGLILFIVTPLRYGGHTVLISPEAFMRRPALWLELISEYGGEVTAAPNFAYDLVTDRTSAQEKAALDLSRLRVAANGAEPVRPATVRRFEAAFAGSGIRPGTVWPCYGMAEATLLMTANDRSADGELGLVVDQAQLSAGVVRPVSPVPAADGADGADGIPLADCGVAPDGHRVRIVDPDAGTVLPEDRVGEILFQGPSVTRGYWSRPRQTELTYHAAIEGESGTWLRSGDLGFLHGGRLYIAGRAKDLMVIRGSNHHPADIERTVLDAAPGLRPGNCAVFSIPSGSGEVVAVVAEVRDRDAPTEDVTGHVRRAVAGAHGVAVAALVLIEPRTLPKTSSGKLQRNATRQAFLDGTLAEVSRWPRPAPAVPGPEPSRDPSRGPARDPSRGPALPGLLARLTGIVAAKAGIDADELEYDTPLADLGLDSRQLAELAAEIESAAGRTLADADIWRYPTLRELSGHLDGTARPQPAPGGGREPVAATEPIAVVGIGCRFPGGDGPEGFWRLLSSRGDAIREVPEGRWPPTVADEPRYGGFLDEAEAFDAAFFGISDHEACRMDPQQRLLLETAWEALADAGIPAGSFRGTRTGVFVGISSHDHARTAFADPSGLDAFSCTGSSAAISANRLSYAFDLHGPSIAIDTACSSSLVAVHQACLSIRTGECGTALAGGVNLILSPDIGTAFARSGLLADDGRCKTFDTTADGYVRGEGAGVVVLKSLSAALADDDRVYAVIRGTAVNSDGLTNGLYAPNGDAQRWVVRDACRAAAVLPGELDYVEAHGTGTQIGDLVEAQALGELLAEGRGPDRPCAIGSVKTNIGHLEAAAGIAGLIKVSLSLWHGEIPASRNLVTPNPAIDWDGLPLRVQLEQGGWPEGGRPPLAGVSSFGFGGTNAHAVLQAYLGPNAPPTNAPPTNTPSTNTPSTNVLSTNAPEPLVLPLSAKGEAELRNLAASYAAMLDASPVPSLVDVCATAARRSTHHRYRTVVVASERSEFAAALRNFARSAEPARGVPRARDGRLAFVFSGQGGHWAGMGLDLYEAEPAFRAALDRCEEVFAGLTGGSVLARLRRPADPGLDDSAISWQAPLFSLQMGLVALYRSWGLAPAAVVGHSVGEAAAACAAGVLSLPDAATVVAYRAEVMRPLAGAGSMALLELTEDEAQQLLEGFPGVFLAAENGPANVVVSGGHAEIDTIVETVAESGVFARRARIDTAGHTPLFDHAAGELQERLAGIRAGEPTTAMFSTVTGGPVGAGELDAAYWARNLRSPVRFRTAVAALAEATDADLVVEISPHSLLSRATAQSLTHAGRPTPTVISSLRAEADGRTGVRHVLGAAFTHGCPIDWDAAAPATGRMVSLPSYPWRRQEFPRAQARPPRGPASRIITSPALAGALIWEHTVDATSVADHRLGDEVVVPAAQWLLWAAEAGAAVTGRPCALEEVELAERMIVQPGEEVRIQLIARPSAADTYAVEWVSSVAGSADWSVHGRCRWVAPAPAPGGESPAVSADGMATADNMEAVDIAAVYAEFTRRGMRYGPGYRLLGGLRRGTDRVLGELTATTDAPALLDGAFQAALCLIADIGPAADDGRRPALVPACLTSVRIADALLMGRPAGPVTCEAVRVGDRVVDIRLRDASGGDLATVAGLEVREWTPRLPISFRRRWQASDVAADVAAADGTWVICGDGTDLGVQLARSLRRRGATAEVLAADPADEAEVRRIRDAVTGRGRGRIVLLFSAVPAPQAAQAQQCVDWLRAVDAELRGVPLWIITDGPHQSPLWGIGRTARAELAGLDCRLVDLGPGAGAESLAELLTSAAPGNGEWSYGGEGWLSPQFEPYPMATGTARLSLSKEATYLVTGGFGGLGLAVTQRLAERGGGRLVLAGRTVPEPGSEAGRRLAAIRGLGAEVLTARVDLGDAAAVHELVKDLERTGPPLRGVIHAAGVLANASIARCRAEDIEAALHGKAHGAWHLHQATADLPLDFFVLFSSAAGVLGSPGQAPYAAANAFLDALARLRRSEGLPGTSVQWGPWAEIGLAAQAGQERLGREGVRPIPPDLALAELERFLGESTEVMVIDADPALLAGRAPAAAGAPGPQPRRPATSLELTRDYVRTQLAAQTGVPLEQLDDHRQLYEIGIDSLMLLELRDQVEEAFGVQVPIKVMYRNPTVDAISAALWQRLSE